MGEPDVRNGCDALIEIAVRPALGPGGVDMKKPRRNSFRSAAHRGFVRGSVGSAGRRGVGEVFPNQTDVISQAHMHVAQNLIAQIIGQEGQLFLGPNKRSRAGAIACVFGSERKGTFRSGYFGTDLRQRGKENLVRVIIHRLATLLTVQHRPASKFIEDC